MTSQETMTKVVGAFVDELSRAGVNQVVISPGSRSSPLAMLMAVHPDIKVWMNVDERSAAFFALGMAKARREPMAILCTSGTAAANYFPAVIEAYEARVPLIVLTADRPHELRDVGAPQTIDQIGLYGSHVKWFKEMALPTDSPAMVRDVRTAAGRAAGVALARPSGPVHLNFPFREPLIPSLVSRAVRTGGRRNKQPYVQVQQGSRRLDDAQIHELANELQGVSHGLIVCGPQDDPRLPQAIVNLANRLQYPVLADPLSQIRNGPHDKRLVIDGYDAFLRDEGIARHYKPEVIIRFGAMPISKAYLHYIERHHACRQIIVESDEGWREPTLLAADMLYADPVQFCEALTAVCTDRQMSVPRWAEDWIQLNRLTQAEIQTRVTQEGLFEGRVFTELAHCMPSDSLLFVGNSMPVRDLDTFFMKSDKRIRTMANRGASGIDGVVSTALGASTAHKPLVLVLGDLSFFHDLNGLLAAKMYALNVTIIVLNNDGGGIFSFLPQAEYPEQFELLFGTPTGLNFRHVVEMYGGSFSRITDWREFRDEVAKGITAPGLSVIEVPTDRQDNADKHRAIWQAVSHALAMKREEA